MNTQNVHLFSIRFNPLTKSINFENVTAIQTILQTDMKNIRLKRRWIIILILMIGLLIIAIYPLPPSIPINYVDRESGLIKTEKVAGEKWLIWLYNNPVGEATLWSLVKRKIVSSFYMKFSFCRISRLLFL